MISQINYLRIPGRNLASYPTAKLKSYDTTTGAFVVTMATATPTIALAHTWRVTLTCGAGAADVSATFKLVNKTGKTLPERRKGAGPDSPQYDSRAARSRLLSQQPLHVEYGWRQEARVAASRRLIAQLRDLVILHGGTCVPARDGELAFAHRVRTAGAAVVVFPGDDGALFVAIDRPQG